MFNNLQKLMMAMALLLIGCSEDRAYNKLDRPTDLFIAKSEIDMEQTYLYIPLYGKTSRYAEDALPQWMGKEKIVKLRYTEESLDILELEQDGRFAANDLNNRPVMSLPVDHLDYRCATDDYDDCTNREELDTTKPWDQRRFANIKLGSMNVREVNPLPIQLKNLGGTCYTKTNVEITDQVVSEDSVLFTALETYETNPACAFSMGSSNLSDLTFHVEVHYNLIKINTLFSKNYQKLTYSKQDQQILGFFDTERNYLGVDNSSDVQQREIFANRWNPERSEIVYYLNDDFKKPENKKILDATIYGVEQVNKGLAKAGAGFRIRLEQGTDEHIKDVRNSMIVLIEDPTEMGVLGFGPSIANPHTGEIFSARTAMYKGNIKQTIEMHYDFQVMQKRQIAAQEEAARQAAAAAAAAAEEMEEPETEKRALSFLAAPRKLVQDSISFTSEEKRYLAEGLESAIESGLPHHMLNPNGHVHSASHIEQLVDRHKKFSFTKMNNIITYEYSDKFEENEITALLSELNLDPDVLGQVKMPRVNMKEVFSRNNVYTAENADIGEAVRIGVEGVIPEGDLRVWSQLSDAERQIILDKSVPIIYLGTLVHEIGHNLGLRHNFGASEDVENHYSSEELAEMGIDRGIPSSSVMEYPFNSFDRLPVLGKYDIAALRYAYAGKVEVETDNGVQEVVVEGPLSEVEDIKRYRYCTDEHVAVNAGCNRHDMGANIVEMTQFQIMKQDFFYNYINHRNNRVSFSLTSDIGYYFFKKSNFQAMRLFFETYERIRAIPQLQGVNWEAGEFPEGMDQGTKDFLTEVAASTANVGNYLIGQLLQPDYMCAIYFTEQQQTQLMPLTRITNDNDVKSCYELELPEQFQVVGHAGKFFESRGTRLNNYADQIDVRGVWIDKLVATEYLFKEELGNRIFDRDHATNFLSHPVLGNQLFNAVAQLLFDDVTVKMPVFLTNGQVPVIDFTYAPSEVTTIKPRIHRVVNYYLGMPSGNTSLVKEVMRRIKRSLNNDLDSVAAKQQRRLFSVVMGEDCNVPGMNELIIGPDRYCASSQHVLANVAINRAKAGQIFAQVEPERLQAIFQEIVAELQGQEIETPLELSEIEAQAKALGPQMIQMQLQGSIKSLSFYDGVLTLLAAE